MNGKSSIATRLGRGPRRAVTASAGVAATTVLALGATPLSAAGVESALAPSQLSSTRISCVEANARVNAVKILGSTVYVGGQFSQVTADGKSYARSRAAAFDLRTCAVLPWNPSVSGEVFAIAPTSSAVYLGGKFSSVGGQNRVNLAAVNPSSGAPLTFSPRVTGVVAELATSSSRLYAAGAIKSVDGQARGKAAAFSLSSGALDSGWRPTVDKQVKGLAVSPDGARVYLAGAFSTINGTAARHLAAVEAGNGQIDTSFRPALRASATEVLAVGTQVVVGYAGNGGQLGVLSTTGALRASAQVDGNLQAVAIRGNEAFAGGHFGNYCGITSATASCSNPTDRRKALSIDATTSALTSFDPQLDSTFGVWAMAFDPATDRLVMGGDFTRAGSRSAAHLAVFGS
jgi:hypothetical protein